MLHRVVGLVSGSTNNFIVHRVCMTCTRLPRAVLLDVDGTLYHQSWLRALMVLELCALPLTVSYRSTTRIWRTLRAFRQVREELRHIGEAREPLEMMQYTETAIRLGEVTTAIEKDVLQWIYQRPLKYLRYCRRRGFHAFLAMLRERDIRVGVFSDYPAHEKLRALGLTEHIELVLSATDPEINAFKPHPKGFLYACTFWGLPPDEVLYIGDRPEVDACGSARAGMPCAILTTKRTQGIEDFLNCYGVFSSLRKLQYTIISV